ncbi:MAG: hypothetical protein BroJett040_10650 [Oligoflexia bacterium]|nr:MAG: hypothetical protein BroJett040_10650 [Oligoflexia bacterium]
MVRKPWLVITGMLAGLLMSLPLQAGTELHTLKGSFTPVEMKSTLSLQQDERAADYIIQYKNSVTEADKSQLNQMGIRIFRYMPDDALIVRADPAMVSKVELLSTVNAVVPFKGAYKLSEGFSAFSVFSTGKYENVLVTALDESDVAQLKTQIQGLDRGAMVLNQDERYLSIRVQETLLPRIANLTGVEFVQKLEKMVPLHMVFGENEVAVAPNAAGDYTDLTGYESGTKVMNFDSIWGAGFAGEGQVVAMADTGLDTGTAATVSADFAGSIVGSGYHFGAGAKNWSDPMGHGTHVAGSVMGKGVTSGGKIRGGAYKAGFVPEAMWSPIIDNLNVPAPLSKLFDGAIKDGASVHTNSWGSPQNLGAYDSMAQKVDEFMWNHPELLIMFAAGNSGTDKNKDGVIDPGSVGTPGTAKNTLTIGASENLEAKGGIQKKVGELRPAKDNWSVEPIFSSKLSDDPNGIACFSSRGPTKDGRLKPELVAPGTNILSARSHEPGAELLWGEYSKDYVWSGGTSMATPLAAGAAAVTREVLVKQHNMKDPSSALVKATMMHTAVDLYPGQYGEGTAVQELRHRPDNNQGYGRVDMKKVAELGSATTFVDNKAGVSQGETQEVTVEVKAGQSLLVNMVYNDAPGTPSSGVNLVNNIDLMVVAPGGKAAGTQDAKNNHEILDLKNLTAGTYKVQVRGTKIPMGKGGKQPFALVYSTY